MREEITTEVATTEAATVEDIETLCKTQSQIPHFVGGFDFGAANMNSRAKT